MTDPENEAAAAVRRAERQNQKVPNIVKAGQRIAECQCGARFDYGLTTDVRSLDPCPECGRHDWHKWGYRYRGEEIRRDEAWDQHDAPPSIQPDSECNGRSQDTGTDHGGRP